MAVQQQSLILSECSTAVSSLKMDNVLWGVYSIFHVGKTLVILGVPRIGETPTSSIFIELSLINLPFWGTPILRYYTQPKSELQGLPITGCSRDRGSSESSDGCCGKSFPRS